MMKFSHKRAPLYQALEEYASSGIVHFDVPGHKKQAGLGGIYDGIMKYDANSTKDLDMLSNPDGVIAEAEALLADAFGADRGFLLVNGSTFGVLAMIMAAVGPNEKIILPRNVHKSAINGIILSGATPVFVEPEIDQEYGVANAVTYQSVKNAIRDNPDAKAVFLINPTYFGAVSDLASIIKLCHQSGLLVLADEAHGAHFPFYSCFPKSATELGADLSTVSMHKTGGSLTQTSVLLMNEGRLRPFHVQSIINLMQTTSASYLLMASVDLARRILVLQGEKRFGQLVALLEDVKAEINRIPGLSCLSRRSIGRAGMYDYDETKIVVKVDQIGLSGFEVYDILKNEHNIQVELAEAYCILAIAGLGDNEETLRALVDALSDLSDKYYGKKKPFTVDVKSFFEKPKTVITPREAFYASKKVVPVDEALGEICGESLMIYPPGIPLIIPGERISENVIENYWFYVRQDCVVMNDGEPGMIQVLS